jgi:hypothetical protein
VSVSSYLTLEMDGVPELLRAQPWIGWREIPQPESKPKKEPYQIGFPDARASNDETKEAERAPIGTPQHELAQCQRGPTHYHNAHPSVKHWRTEADVREVQALAPELFDGFGIALTVAGELTFIDLDHVRDPETGTLDHWVARLVQAFDSWTEISVSGTGVHIFCRGQLPGTGLVNFLDGDPAMKIEAYSVGRFAYLTGHAIAAVPIAERQSLLTLLAQHVRPPDSPDAPSTPALRDEAPIPAGARNDTLFRIARGFVCKGLHGEALTAALIAVSHRRCVPVPPDADVATIARHADRLPDRRPA